jgi:hypothetical protein
MSRINLKIAARFVGIFRPVKEFKKSEEPSTAA